MDESQPQAEFIPERSGNKAPFPVVGIGASAGGLRTLQQFLQNTPLESGLAYVIVTHLTPEHESHMAELLRHHTTMPVTQVTQDMPIEKNHVYIIPPNRNLSTIDTHLKLSALEENRRERAPIDHFFRTLAETHEANAICVVLSGTGSDGTLGLERIKEVGGLTVVQDPVEAEYDSMPQNAIATGQVDLVLPVREIPVQIVNYVRRVTQFPTPEDGELLAPTLRESLQKILTQVRLQTGHDFSRYKTATIMRRIQHRMQILNISEFDTYLALLRTQGKEVQALFNDFLITVTNFFRNAEAFEELEREVIPKLFLGKKADESVRVWVVGCATGEEAYSVAILLLEYANQLDTPPNLQIFASDLSESALRKAREGVFPEVSAIDISSSRLQRYFVREQGGYRIRKEVREIVLFAPHNVLKDPPFSRIDLITCRNMLIYLQREVQRDVFELFHYALRPQGYLFLGSSEVLDGSMLFQAINRKHSLYQRQNVTLTERHLPALPLTAPTVEAFTLPVESIHVQRGGSYNYAAAHGRLVDRFGPSSLLVNADYNMVYLSSGVSRYLFQPAGVPNNNILKRVREELRVELTTALFRAFERGEPTLSAPVKMRLDGEDRRVSVQVWPSTQDDDQNVALVLFFEQAYLPADGTSDDIPKSDNILALEEDLSALRKSLQTTVEEFESSQEEMRASNEELQSMNEELRSTAEELETSKEELQSINEELITVNQENKNKVEELSELASDLQNLLAATDIATLFLDRELRITRFTPRVSELFNVRASDRDRPLAHLTHRLGYQNLIDDAAAVLRTLVPVEREVSSESGRGYLMRLLPYRTIEDKIDGVVITFVDITERIQNEQALQQLTASLDARVKGRTEQVQELASRLLTAELQVQERIAHVLHDELQQLLYSINIRLQMLQNDLKSEVSPTISESISELEQTIHSALDIIRNLTIELAPPIGESGDLGEALRGLATRMEQMHALTVRIDTEGVPAITDSRMSAMLYQMVRELLFNVVKHANVKEATVVARIANDTLQVTVVDKGAGFDMDKQAENARQGNAFGLGNINGRLGWQGGRLELDSTPGQGTRATIYLPLTPIPQDVGARD